jgi:hypothetical protein
MRYYRNISMLGMPNLQHVNNESKRQTKEYLRRAPVVSPPRVRTWWDYSAFFLSSTDFKNLNFDEIHTACRCRQRSCGYEGMGPMDGPPLTVQRAAAALGCLCTTSIDHCRTYTVQSVLLLSLLE